MPLENYTCAYCGERCASTVPDEVAVAEYEALHRKKFKRDEVEVLCDDCFKLFTAEMKRP